MAFIQCSFYSKTLRIQTAVNVILPEQKKWPTDGDTFPVVWLYHGMFDNQTSWARNTSIERYAEDTGLAVVMPDAQRSYYTDMKAGGAYWKFISDELIRKARRFFPLDRRREYNFAAGVSMGGFGAFKLALNRPELVAAAGSLSGVLDIPARLKMNRGYKDEFRRIFGSPEEVPNSIDDLIRLVSQIRGDSPLPLLYQCCGTKDIFLHNNRNFHEAAIKADVPLHYEEDEGFGHQWEYWDIKIAEFFTWIRNMI